MSDISFDELRQYSKQLFDQSRDTVADSGGTQSSDVAGDIKQTTNDLSTDGQYVPCDGQKYLQSEYPNLYSRIGLITDGFKDSSVTSGFPLNAYDEIFVYNPVYDYFYAARYNYSLGHIRINDKNYNFQTALTSSAEVGNVRDMAVSANGNILAYCGGSPHYYNVYDVQNNHTLIADLPAIVDPGTALGIDVSPNGQFVAISYLGTNSNYLDVLDLNTKSFVTLPQYPSVQCRDVKFMNNSNKLVVTTNAEDIMIIDCDNSFNTTVLEVGAAVYNGYKIDISPDDNFLVSVNNGDYNVIDLTLGQVVADMPLIAETCVSCGFSPDGKWLALNTNTASGTIYAIDWEKKELKPDVATIEASKDIVWSPDSTFFGVSVPSSGLRYKTLSVYSYDPTIEFVTPTEETKVYNAENVKAFIKKD